MISHRYKHTTLISVLNKTQHILCYNTHCYNYRNNIQQIYTTYVRHLSASVALDIAHQRQHTIQEQQNNKQNQSSLQSNYNNNNKIDNKPTNTVRHHYNNITPRIQSKVGINLHNQPNHPISLIKQRIVDYFNTQYKDTNNKHTKFNVYDNLSPVVSTTKCFDELFIPTKHVSRRPTDTFYYNKTTVLRTHTSAHEREMLIQPDINAFLIAGDCYRRDEIDSTHYPVFHQMEGVRVYKNATTEYAVTELKHALEGLARYLFGHNVELQWDNDVSFPWTSPSFELYVKYNDKWLEVLGCGIIKQRSLIAANRHNSVAWAFGMGLDRLAMILFQIPDIRLFWSDDERFLNQFKKGQYNTIYQPFSKYPHCYKDITFWLPAIKQQEHSHDTLIEHAHSDPGVTMQNVDTNNNSSLDDMIQQTGWHDNDFFALVREIAGDLVEQINIIDTFHNKKLNKISRCYRIIYRDHSRNLTNEEVDELQDKVREHVVKLLNVELR